jgi:hypothetical protein
MPFPSKAITNLTRAMAILQPGTSQQSRVLHFALARCGGPKGEPRLAFFPRATDATEAKLKEVWTGDAEVAKDLHMFRGAVRLGPEGVSVVPANRANKVLSPGAVKESWRVAKKQLTGHGVNVSALQHLVDAEVEPAADTAQLVGKSFDDEERVTRGSVTARDKLKIDDDTNVRSPRANVLGEAWNTLEDEIEETLALLDDWKAGRVTDREDIKLIVLAVDQARARVAKVHGEATTLREELASATLGQSRFGDSIRLLEEVAARAGVRLADLNRPMVRSEQDMVASAKDLVLVAKKQDEVHIERRQGPGPQVHHRVPANHSGVTGETVKGALDAWGDLSDAVRALIERPDWETTRSALLVDKESGDKHRQARAKKLVNTLSRLVERLDDKVGRFHTAIQGELSTLEETTATGPEHDALVDLLARADLALKDLQAFQLSLGVVRLTPSQAWALVSAELKGEDEQSEMLAKAKKRWTSLIGEWSTTGGTYTEGDLPTVMEYIKGGGAMRVATQYRLEKTVGGNARNSSSPVDDTVPLAKLLMTSGFRNVWETGVSQASADVGPRGGVEERMGYGAALRRQGGKRSEDPMTSAAGSTGATFDPENPSEMPRYAAIITGAQTGGVAPRYGASYIVWKESVKERMTHTPTDSWTTGPGNVARFTSSKHPEPVVAHAEPLNVRLIAAEATGKDTEFTERFKATGGTYNGYVETQLHGDLSWDDVAEVVIDAAATNRSIADGNFGENGFQDAEQMATLLTAFAVDEGYDFIVRAQ